MCLAIPGKVLEVEGSDVARTGRVQFGGIVRQVNFSFVPEASVDDYVLVHVGFAISVVNREEAERTYQLLREMGMLDDDLPGEVRPS